MSSSRLKDVVTLRTQGPEDTFQLGVSFGGTAQGGEVVALIGTLGVGKTQFVKGLAQGLGILPEDVTSPTFSLMQSYEGRLILTHIDLYRLEKQSEMFGLGLEEEIEDASGLAAIEWADKGAHILPPGRLLISLKPLEGVLREIVIQSTDVVHQAWQNRSLKKYAGAQRTDALDGSK